MITVTLELLTIKAVTKVALQYLNVMANENLTKIIREGGSHKKRTGGARRTFQGLKKAVLVPLRVFSLKRSSVGA